MPAAISSPAHPAACVVDASVWVSAFIPSDVHHARSLVWVQRQTSGSRRVVVPALVLPEVAGALARRLNDTAIARAVAGSMRRLPQVDIVDLDEDLAGRAAALAATLRLRGADAVYVAVAQVENLPLVTWDQEQLTRAAAVVPTRTP